MTNTDEEKIPAVAFVGRALTRYLQLPEKQVLIEEATDAEWKTWLYMADVESVAAMEERCWQHARNCNDIVAESFQEMTKDQLMTLCLFLIHSAAASIAAALWATPIDRGPVYGMLGLSAVALFAATWRLLAVMVSFTFRVWKSRLPYLNGAIRCRTEQQVRRLARIKEGPSI